MKLLYITASLPYGTDEAFIISELSALLRLGHELLIVPRSPNGSIIHGAELVKHARRERLLSSRVMRSAVQTITLRPKAAVQALAPVLRSRSAMVLLKNLAVAPKAYWLAKVASKWGADHIHCHWAGTTATMAMVASRLTGIPWSFTAHRWDIVEDNLLALKARDSAFVRFIAHDGVRMARARGVDCCGKIRVLHMGVDVPDQEPTALRGPVRLLCPARLTEVKGHRFLLSAWEKVHDQWPDGELWLAGDGELRPALTSEVLKQRLDKSVRFLGTVPHGELLRLYENGTITAVVLASLDLGCECHEGIPVALVEAMSYAIPVIATTTGGITELVTPRTGYLVPPGDATALAHAIESVVRRRVLATDIGVAARQRVLEKFNAEHVGSELESAFAEALQTIQCHRT